MTSLLNSLLSTVLFHDVVCATCIAQVLKKFATANVFREKIVARENLSWYGTVLCVNWNAECCIATLSPFLYIHAVLMKNLILSFTCV